MYLQKNKIQIGRSMIETLGVLAIVGVLSVGGIAGYTKAMKQNKINKTLNQVSHMVINTRALFKQKSIYNMDGSNSPTGLAVLKKANIVPDEMWKNGAIESPIGTTFGIGAAGNTIGIAFGHVDKDSCMTLATYDWNNMGVRGVVVYESTTSGVDSLVSNWRPDTSAEELYAQCMIDDDIDYAEHKNPTSPLTLSQISSWLVPEAWAEDLSGQSCTENDFNFEGTKVYRCINGENVLWQDSSLDNAGGGYNAYGYYIEAGGMYDQDGNYLGYDSYGYFVGCMEYQSIYGGYMSDGAGSFDPLGRLSDWMANGIYGYDANHTNAWGGHGSRPSGGYAENGYTGSYGGSRYIVACPKCELRTPMNLDTATSICTDDSAVSLMFK